MTTQIETTSTAGSWLHPAEPAPDARIRLILFPHAGSGAIIYRDWGTLLPGDVAPQAVTLPGRHNRRDESSYGTWEPLMDALHEAVVRELDDRPYAFFGHCMGAQLAYQLTQRIEASGDPGPLMLGMSGWAPRGFFVPTEQQSRMPEPEMVEWIKKLGSFPAEIYDNPQMLALVVPALRADLAVCSQYVDDGATVRCPIASYGGAADPLMEQPDAMDSWRDRTPRYLGNSEYPGGHFYIDSHALAVTSDVVRHLYRLEAAHGR
ncbi:alpha/beta fold hydrolase [Micromonospora sp. NPDC000207]|uniref:thioesterase II family protein n=1 Tax=Micromonospora sp. NPDC000207 TaxID=3154246 RepID=UPI003330AB20